MLKEKFLNFRTSRGFFILLGCFVFSWMICHWLLRWFDPDLGGYNSILSTEASIMISVLFEYQRHNDMKLDATLREIREMVVLIKQMIGRVEEDVDEIRDEIEN